MPTPHRVGDGQEDDDEVRFLNPTSTLSINVNSQCHFALYSLALRVTLETIYPALSVTLGKISTKKIIKKSTTKNYQIFYHDLEIRQNRQHTLFIKLKYFKNLPRFPP